MVMSPPQLPCNSDCMSGCTIGCEPGMESNLPWQGLMWGCASTFIVAHALVICTHRTYFDVVLERQMVQCPCALTEVMPCAGEVPKQAGERERTGAGKWCGIRGAGRWCGPKDEAGVPRGNQARKSFLHLSLYVAYTSATAAVCAH